MTTILRALQALSDKWRSDALIELCYYADALVACADELDTLLATHDMGEMVPVPRESEERFVDAKPEHAALDDDVVDAEFWPDRGDQQ